MNNEIIQSAGGIIYFIDQDNEPRFLIIKRQARTKKIERVAPKWKVKPWEDPKQTTLREICEETWLPINNLIIWQKVWVLELRQESTKTSGSFEKDITFFIVRYDWDKNIVDIIDWEGYTWQYKRATIKDISNLIYFPNMRNLFLTAFHIIKQKNKNKSVKEEFLKKI